MAEEKEEVKENEEEKPTKADNYRGFSTTPGRWWIYWI